MAHSSQSITRGALILAACQAAALPFMAARAGAAAAAKTASKGAAKTAPKVPSEAQASAALGKVLLDQAEAKINAANTITVTSTIALTEPGRTDSKPVTVTATLQRPGSVSIDLAQSDKEIGKIVSSPDGGYVYDAANNRYVKVDKADTPLGTLRNTFMAAQSVIPPDTAIGLFMVSSFLMEKHPLALEVPAGAQVNLQVRSYPGALNGTPIQHVTQTIAQGANSTTIHVYVDSRTGLPVRVAYTGMQNGKAAGSLQSDFSAFQLGDTPLPDSTFQYTPPATATAYTPPAEPQEPPVLANGATAPDFAVQDVNGKTVHLADFAGKVVVIDFWATWCGPCQMSLPGTDKVAKKYQAKGVVFVPVCSWDEKSAFTPWVQAHKNWAMSFYFDPAGRGKDSIAGTLYKVSGIPTQFVIGKDGKVAWSTVGYDGEESEKSLVAAIDKAVAGS